MNRISNRDAADAIARREVFKSHTGSLRGTTAVSTVGWLEGPDRDAFNRDWRDMTYVVYSYQTPIAWETKDGKVHKVAQRFSNTTSRHQGRLYKMGA